MSKANKLSQQIKRLAEKEPKTAQGMADKAARLLDLSNRLFCEVWKNGGRLAFIAIILFGCGRRQVVIWDGTDIIGMALFGSVIAVCLLAIGLMWMASAIKRAFRRK